MIEVLVDEQWVEKAPSNGDKYRKSKNGKVYLESFWYEPSKTDLEKQWRDSELLRTDSMLQPDRPNYETIISYRQALRDYPESPNFPEGERPTLSE